MFRLLRIIMSIALIGSMLLGSPAEAKKGDPLTDPLGPGDIVVDNKDNSSQTGTVVLTPGNESQIWSTSSNNPSYNYGSDRHQIYNGGGATFTWIPAIPHSGNYAVYVNFHGTTGRANPVPYEIYHGGESTIVNVNQTNPGLSNGYWFGLGQTVDSVYVNSYYFEAGTSNYIKIDTTGTTGWVLADAVRLVPLFDPPPDGDATLSSLAVNPGTLAFDPQVEEYRVNVPGSADSIAITPTVSSSAAYKSLTINGHPTVSGSAYSVSLQYGINMISIQVTAQNDTVKTYQLEVSREDLSADADLSGLQIAPGNLEFDRNTTRYSVEVTETTDTIAVTPMVSSSVYRSLTVNGQPAVSGETYMIVLNKGFNLISIEVTAQDGIAKKLYMVDVLRKDSVARLSGLVLNHGSLPFAPGKTGYRVFVGHSFTELAITPQVTSQEFAQLTINGVSWQPGTAYSAALAEGANSIAVNVLSKSGENVVYTIEIVRLDASSDPRLLQGLPMLPAETLAEVLGLELYQDDSGLNVFSRSALDFSEAGGSALKKKLVELLDLQLTVDGRAAAFFDPAVNNYKLLLHADGSIPVIGLQSAADTQFTVSQASTVDQPAVLWIAGVGEYTFSFTADPFAGQVSSGSVANRIKVSYTDQDSLPDEPTWIPVQAVTMSSGHNYGTTSTIDNDLATRWSAEGEQWICYDLGSVTNVHAMALSATDGDMRRMIFDIEVSDDGDNFTKIWAGESSGTTSYPEIYPLNDVQARYVRIMGHGNSSSRWNSYNEVRFYEDQSQQELDMSYWDMYFYSGSFVGETGTVVKLNVTGIWADGSEQPLPEDTRLTFTSLNSQVASVDQDGNLAIVGAGETVIGIQAVIKGFVRMENFHVIGK